MGTHEGRSQSARLRFGSFEIDTHSRELRKNGIRLKLADQGFEVLATLLERAGEVITREELQRKLWHADTAIDFDHGLNKAINRIRDVLGDSAEYPHFVETLPKRGYRFIGHVDTIGTPPTPSVTSPPLLPAAPARRPVVVWITVAAILLALSLVGLSRIPGKPAPAGVIRASILLSPESPVGPGLPILSPEGSHLVFSAPKKDDADGKHLLWVRPLASEFARSLDGTEGAGHPFWSPDGHDVGFFSGTVLKRVAREGGPSSILGDFRSHGRGGTWNRDGVILFSLFSPNPIYRIRATGGAAQPVTRLQSAAGQISHRWPYFLPNGRHFLYAARTIVESPKRESDAIHVADLDGREDQFLLYADSNAIYAQGHLLFVRQGGLMAQEFDPVRLRLQGSAQVVAGAVALSEDHGSFSASETGLLVYGRAVESETRLIWFDRQGRETGSVGNPGRYFRPRISPDGKWVAVDALSRGRINRDIWIYDSSRGLGTQITFDPFIHTHAVWSPDATQLAFASSRSGQRSLLKLALGGAQTEQVLLDGEGDKTVSDWSRDGDLLAYNYHDPKKTKLAIWILPLSGKRPPFAFQPAEYEQKDAQFSPDGRWLAYTSAASGREEIYIASFPGATYRRRISANGGSQPRWRRDGKELYYLAQNDCLMAAGIACGRDAFEIGSVRPLFQTRPARVVIGHIYDVSPDGQHFLINTFTERAAPQPETLVINWRTALR
jgi:Tol biopolymer transport system component/DNA-binding winged helix-turn-helix (wHTH) protein